MRVPCCCVLLAALWQVAASHAQSPSGVVVTAKAPGLTVQEIVQRAVANDELRTEHRRRLECEQIITTDRLDESGKIFKTKTVQVEHRESPAFAYSDPTDLPPDKASKDGDTVKAQRRMAEMNLRKLAPRFQYTLTSDDASVRGRVCYIVEFSPGEAPGDETREEKVIDHLHGRYWIDKKTFEILQGEGSLAAPASVGLFAAVTQMHFALRTQTLPSGEAGPADFSLDFSVKAPLYFYRQRQLNRLENWRLAGR